MARSKPNAGAVVTYRPDPETGELVAVATEPARKPRQAASVRQGAVFGVWDDLTQSWEHGPCSLAEAVAAMDDCQGGHPSVAFYRGEYYPGNLNAAEKAAVMDGLQ